MIIVLKKINGHHFHLLTNIICFIIHVLFGLALNNEYRIHEQKKRKKRNLILKLTDYF